MNVQFKVKQRLCLILHSGGLLIRLLAILGGPSVPYVLFQVCVLHDSHKCQKHSEEPKRIAILFIEQETARQND
jgi:hypothetical protein